MPEPRVGERRDFGGVVGVWDGKGWKKEQAQPTSPQPSEEGGTRLGAMAQTFGNVLAGGAKGAGETAFRLGQLVHNTPGLGSVTDAIAKAVGPEGTDPDAAFSRVPEELEAEGTAQAVGKGVEQIGEYFIPASPARLAAIRQMVRMIPNSASGPMMKMLNKAATLAGRMGGEAASATGVSMLHGEDDPERTALLAAAGPLAGKGVSRMAQFLRTPMGRRLAPLLAATGSMSALGPSGLGIGATIGMFGGMRALGQQMVQNPQLMRSLPEAARKATETGARVGVAGEEYGQRVRRRRLEQ